jgi:TPR repeat protein
MLARYLAHGATGDPDPESAGRWFREAAAQGLAEAEAELAAVETIA